MPTGNGDEMLTGTGVPMSRSGRQPRETAQRDYPAGAANNAAQGMSMNQERVRAAVIGFGNMGSAHANHIYNGDVPGMELAAVCDTDSEKCDQARKHFGRVRTETDYRKILADGEIDAVIIAVPHPLHPVIAGEALKAGKHVLTEKPAGIDVASVQELNHLAEQTDRVFGIMFNQRTNELYAKMRELMRNGTLGEMKRTVWIVSNWYRTQAYYDSGDWRATWNGEGGGVLMNQCPHNLDLWQWICGMPCRLRAVCRVGHYHDIDVEDDAVLYTEYANGASGVFMTSTGEYPGTNRLEISGTRGKAVIENGALTLSLIDEDERKLVKESKEGFPSWPVHTVAFRQEKPDSAHLGILKNFTDAILYGAPLLAPGIDGIHELMLANAAYLSSAEDRWVDLPLDGEKYLDFLHTLREKEKKRQEEEGKKGEKETGENGEDRGDRESQETGHGAQGHVDESVHSGEYSDRWQVRWN